MVQKYIYIMISRTHTGFGTVIRTVGNMYYNHASVSLDAELNQMYAFARPNHNALLLARLVRETVPRYTMKKNQQVDIVIYRIPVTPEQYKWAQDTIYTILNDKAYIYNYLSVLSHPLLKGFSTYKAFSCIEFVMYLLAGVGIVQDKPRFRYNPDDLLELLQEYQYFQGNLLDYKKDYIRETDYFDQFTYKMAKESIFVAKEVFVRLFAPRSL